MATVSKEKYVYGMGRRKNAVATVRIYQEKGESKINEKELKNYLPAVFYDLSFVNVFETAGLKYSDFYFTSKVQGGGLTGQVGAIVLALARAITKLDKDARKPLKDAHLLTRDPRMVERKKTGLHKARKREQYSKR